MAGVIFSGSFHALCRRVSPSRGILLGRANLHLALALPLSVPKHQKRVHARGNVSRKLPGTLHMDTPKQRHIDSTGQSSPDTRTPPLSSSTPGRVHGGGNLSWKSTRPLRAEIPNQRHIVREGQSSLTPARPPSVPELRGGYMAGATSSGNSRAPIRRIPQSRGSFPDARTPP